MRRSRIGAAVAALAIASAALVVPASGAPGDGDLGEIGALGLGVGEAVSTAPAAPVELSGGLRPARRGLRVMVVSSGVDTTVLPAAARAQVTPVSDPNLPTPAGDPLGYGTWAASIVLQAAPGAEIVSAPVFDQLGRTSPHWVWYATRLASIRKDVDAVLLAFPPSDFLDPVSASMVNGEWETMLDAMADRPLPSVEGPVAGIPMPGELRGAKTMGAGAVQYHAVQRFAWLAHYWNAMRSAVRSLEDAGIAVVVPAGDLGPSLQTILGVAGLREVVTVGAGDAGRIATTSSSGPAADGTIKPDVVAPAGVAGLLPPSSRLAGVLDTAGRLDRSLKLDWEYGEPVTDARARIDTTLTSAAVVAVSLAGLHAEGVRDTAIARASLAAAALPVAGEPAWRQGAGSLRRSPDAAFAAERPLVLGHADLGLNPGAGPWTRRLSTSNATPDAGEPVLSAFVGVTPALTNEIRADVPAPEQPPVTVEVSQDGVEVAVPAGEHSHRAGLWCGYTKLAFLATDVEPRVDAHGLPLAQEQVPTCLVQGTRVRAQAFYLHNDPAENTTFAFFPALPPGASLLELPFHILKVDPLDLAMLWAKPTRSPWGYAFFENVPPGYYKVKEFSDYGAPTVQTVEKLLNDAHVPADIPRDIGGNPGYQSFKALVLPPECPEAVEESCNGGVFASTEAGTQSVLDEFFSHAGDRLPGWLRGAVQPLAFEFDVTTRTWLVGPRALQDNRLRIAIGCLPDSQNMQEIVEGVAQTEADRHRTTCFKKAIGTAVTSRYIDLLDFEDLRYWSSWLTSTVTQSDVNKQTGIASGMNGAWRFSRPAGGGNGVSALYNPASAAASGTNAGIGVYPFNLTTPNYSAHMSLNFTYELTNSFILILVQMGEDHAWAVVTPDGLYRAGNGSSIDANKWYGIGRGSGRANFEFNLLPRGAPEGVMWVLFVPPVNVPSVAGVEIADLSFQLDTWTPAGWPPSVFEGPIDDATGAAVERKGHAFTVDSRYNAPRTILSRQLGTIAERQIAHPPKRRMIDNGQIRAEVVEDWQVMVHSPGNDAATFELCDVLDDIDEGGSSPPPIPPTGACMRTRMKWPNGELQDALPLLTEIPRSELIAAGAGFGDPNRGTIDFAHVLAFNCTIGELWSKAGIEMPRLHANGRFFEQLPLPRSVLAGHRKIEFHIVDNIAGRHEAYLPHDCGDVCVHMPDDGHVHQSHTYRGAPVRVLPYIPFLADAVFVPPEDGWSVWHGLGGVGTSAPDAASWGDDHVDEYVRGTDSSLYYRRSIDGTFGNWASLAYPSTTNRVGSAPGVASRGPGLVDAFVTGEDGGLWWRSQAAGGKWSPWTAAGAPCSGTITIRCGLRSGPDAASRGPDRLDVVAAGNDGQLWHREGVLSSGSWEWRWVPLGAPPAGLCPCDEDPSLVAVDGGKLHLLVRGGDDRLWWRVLDGTWSDWTRLDAPTTKSGGGLASGPDAAAWAGGIQVFAKGVDQAIWGKRYDASAGWQAWRSVGGPAYSAPAVAASDRLHVFIRGPGDGIWYKTCCD